MCITSRMLLGLEQSIKIPERVLDVVIRWHLSESVQQSFSKKGTIIMKIQVCSDVTQFHHLQDRAVHCFDRITIRNNGKYSAVNMTKKTCICRSTTTVGTSHLATITT
jgi:ABC-type multidrug transport system ATPase subunit